MKDISTHASKSKVKPELQHIYVHQVDNIKYAVATDTFRMAIQNLSWTNDADIPNGFYDVKNWKAIVREKNKKATDQNKLEKIYKQVQAVQEEMEYPNYKQIIPENIESLPKAEINKISKDYLYDMLKLMSDKRDTVDFNKIVRSKSMLIYSDTEVTSILMERN